MENNFLGIGISFLAVFSVLGGITLVRARLGLQEETSRKLVHILVGNWVLLLPVFFTSAAWACVVPACFVVLNALSYKKNVFSVMERSEKSSLGTVWYAVSLLLLTAGAYALQKPYLAICGVLAMAYGDGLAALAGRRWGKRHFPPPGADKTIEGSGVMFLFSGAPVFVVLLFFSPGIAFAAAFASASAATLLELVSPKGLDNLTVPAGVFLTVAALELWPGLAGYASAFGLVVVILLFAWGLRGLTSAGTFAAFFVGTLLFWWGGWFVYGALISFFVLGSLVSRLGKRRKQSATCLHERHGARTVAQVAANALPALLFALGYRITGWEPCLLAALACFCGANADTFSSEIGMLSKRQPVSILTLRPIQRGISGGVTALGVLAAALGSMLISLFALPRFGLKGMLITWGLGVIASLLDSLLGATIQAKYRLSSSFTERPFQDGIKLELASGIAFINNDMVNFLSLSGSGLCCLAVLCPILL